MDKNIKEKIKEFFRKEGFYVALLVCLCLVATVVVVNMGSKNNDTAVESNNEFTLENEESSFDNKQNAERVENETKDQVAEEATDENSVETANTSELILYNPIEGSLCRQYTYPTPVEVSSDVYRNIKGIDIAAEVGTTVKSAGDGVIEEVGNKTEEGSYVVVSHSNGIKTKYTNLAEEIQVKQGDTIEAGTVLGTVGNTSKIFTNDKYGEHLNLQVLDSYNQQVDPQKYFGYKPEE